MDQNDDRILMARYVVAGTVLQAARVVGGHYSGAIVNNSALIGFIIAFGIGGWFGATAVRRVGHAAAGGLVAAAVSGFLGILLAVLWRDNPWLALVFGTILAGAAGMVGGTILFLATGGRPPPPPVSAGGA